MGERYTRIFSLEENLYTVGSPVIISAGTLLRDNTDNSVLAQIKFKNISDRKISAIIVRLMAYDVLGNFVEEVSGFQYLDLDAKRNEFFGHKTPVKLQSNTVRSYKAWIKNVIFDTGEQWEDAEFKKEWKVLENQQPARIIYDKRELLKQYQIELTANSQYMYMEYEDLWLCSCGGINHNDEDKCSVCRLSREKNIKYMDKDLVISCMNERLIREDKLAREKAEVERQEREIREQQEKERLERDAEENRRKKKRTMIAVGLALGVLIAIVVIFTVLSKTSMEGYLERGKYEKAYEKAKTDESKQEIEIENLVAVAWSCFIDLAVDPSEYELLDAYYSKAQTTYKGKPAKELVLCVGLSDPPAGYGGVFIYTYFYWNDEVGLGVSNCISEYVASYKTHSDDDGDFYDDNEIPEKVLEAVAPHYIKVVITDANSDVVNEDGIDRINKMYEDGTLDNVELLDIE